MLEAKALKINFFIPTGLSAPSTGLYNSNEFHFVDFMDTCIYMAASHSQT